MLRASTFCRQDQEFHVSLRTSAGPQPETSETSWQILRRIQQLSGTIVSLSCQSGTVIYSRLLVRKECEDDDDQEKANNEEERLWINISMITAANLGLTWNPTQIQSTLCGTLKTGIQQPVVAQSITLTAWGIPYAAPTLKYVPRAHDVKFPLPRNGTILQRGCLITVTHADNIYFYEVTEILGNDETNDQACPVFESSSDTFFRIKEARQTTLSPGLPPILPRHWYAPHPDVNILTRLLSLTPQASVGERIVHYHGSSSEADEDLATAVANQLGRRCVSVKGLAFYAHWSGRLSANPTGSLTDQLQGLRAALEEARLHAPSLLWIHHLDRELSTADQELRHDQECRIWSVCQEFLAASPSMATSWSSEILIGTPSVVLVLHSSKELPYGPILQGLVFSPISASLPHSKYLEFLWSKRFPLYAFDQELEQVLLGRSVEQVLAAFDELAYECGTVGDNVDVVETLINIVGKIDGRSRQTEEMGKIPSVHWEDVGGLSHVRREIMDAIELPLQHPHLFPSSSTRSGILFYGPPGTGKTLVAKAAATECGLPFMSIKGPELLGSYIGESESNVREVFSKARALARLNNPPACILFFDELDSLAPRRGEQGSGGNVMDRVVATFFAELDKEVSDASVFVLGATNRPDLLDISLLRPGRFDRLLYLGINPEDRASILAAQIAKLHIEDDPIVMAETVVQGLSELLTGADLSTIASGAQLIATRRLCNEADDELDARRLHGESNLQLDELLDSWNEERRTPVVTLADLLQASKKVVSSVSASDLKRYETLRQQFRR